jgi:hypothetical protein
MAKIVETDNFGGDYPDEKFVNLPRMTPYHARLVADAINKGFDSPYTQRYWKVVEDDYTLQPAFEP